MSQLNDASLERLINSFTRASVHETADVDEEYLLEEDCDEYVDLDEDGDENEESKLSNLARLFTVYLKELALERLSDLLVNKPNLIMYIYARIKYLAQKLTINYENDEAKTKLIEMLNYIELAHDKIETSETSLQFESFASFFIVTLKISYVLFDMLKQMTPAIGEQDDNLMQSQSSQSSHRTVFISSQISTSIGLNKFNSDLSNRLNLILIKQASIIEKKINNFNENKLLQIKLIYFLNKLLGDYLYEAKTMAFIWKLITKIVIKNRLFSDTDMNEIAIKSKNDTVYSIKFIFNKLFYCVYKMTYYHLKRFKLDLLKQSNLNEMGKLFKYTGFLFKIFKTFVIVYHSFLADTEAFYLVTNIFSVISMLQFQREHDLNYKKFKFEFSKEIAPLTDELIDLYAQNDDYLAYLNELNLAKFEKVKLDLLSKFALVYKVVDTENYYDRVDYYEEVCLFYSMLINRAANAMDHELITATLDNLIELTSVCTRACNLPLELISFELFRYDLAKLNDLNYKSDCLHIEFYDLILINLFNYCMLNIQSFKFVLSYFINNLTLNEWNKKQQLTIRIYMCRELLELVLKKLFNLKIVDSFKVFQFLFDAYEFSVLNTSACLTQYEECLSELVRFHSSRFEPGCILRLVDYLREAKYFTSFSLIMSLQLKQLSSRAEYSVSKVIDYFTGFYGDLSTFLTQQAKQIDQNLLKKLINFIKNKNGFSIIKWVKFNSNNLNQTLVESTCKCLNAFFLKLDFVETFLKLFESFIQVTLDVNSKQSAQIYDNFKFVFEFIFNSVRVWSELASQSNEADKLVLLDFLQRYINKQADSEFTLILLNFKYQAAYALARLLDKEIKESNLRKKVIDLACNLSDQSANPILKEMLTKYLGNLASYGHVNSKIVVEMVRLNTNIREIVSHNSSELNFGEDKTLDMILIENNIQLLEEIRKKQQEKHGNQSAQESQPNLNEITFDIGAKCALDDTMNAIFDTTMDVSSSSSQAIRVKFDKQFEQAEENLNELIENYLSADKPRWVKEKINLMFKTYSEKL